MSKTSIEWTQETWNPARGCSRVSPGCVKCYAERMAARELPGMKSPTTGEPFAIMTPSGPHWTGKVELIPHMLDVPLRRKKPTTYFVNSMSDLFHEGLSDEAIDRVFAVMAQAKQHTFQVLTKRADRMLHIMTKVIRTQKFWPLANVWLGCSVEDRARKNRIDILRETPAAVRFLSLEPLLEDLGDITRHLRTTDESSIECSACDWRGAEEDAKRVDTPDGEDWWFECPKCAKECAHTPIDELGPGIDWVIVGGESGPGARPCDLSWIRSIVEQSKAAGVPVFVKQLGADPLWPREVILHPPRRRSMKLKDRKGGDPSEWPADLRVREMPEAKR